MNGPNDTPPKPSFGPEENDDSTDWEDVGLVEKLALYCIVAMVMAIVHPRSILLELYMAMKHVWAKLRGTP